MKIDLEKLEALKLEAGKIFLEPEGEKVLVQILEIQQQVEDAVSEVKRILEEKALAIDPNFSSIQADQIKVYYRQYGSRYKIDESQIKIIPKDLYTVKESYYPISEAIEKYTEEHGGMPAGVIEPERPKQLTFSLKNHEPKA